MFGRSVPTETSVCSIKAITEHLQGHNMLIVSRLADDARRERLPTQRKL